MEVNAAIEETVAVKHDAEAESVQELFKNFLEEFQGEKGNKKYLAEVENLVEPERNTLFVDYLQLQRTNDRLTEAIVSNFYRMYPYLCCAVKLIALDLKLTNVSKKEFYVSIVNLPIRHRVRELLSEKIGQLIKITGQVVRTHPVHPELARAAFVCDECGVLTTGVEQQFKYTQPTKCSNPACTNRNRFVLDIHKSMFIDFQKIRIQEVQSELPRGSIPRSVEVIVRGELCERAQPGDRCDFTGTLIVIPDVSQLSTPGTKSETSSRQRGRQGNERAADGGLTGLKALGVRDLSYKLAFIACNIAPVGTKVGSESDMDVVREEMSAAQVRERMSDAEFEKIREMAEDKDVMNNLTSSLFPSIYGNEEVKRGALLMLFGGVPKRTREGITLRGDINVCLVGDPSTAKSQILKRIEEFSPRAVYTSGKASTAAGLTAAVVKDEESFEFVIEAGALMLADNGVCCIDEFDKMDPKDQVAIHEAMEQQTISIAKAGVKATLNARTSILAAANPIGGRYDRSRSLRQNIQLSAPIMSRFDLFFVLVDDCNEVTDYAVARRILDVHRNKENVVKTKYTTEDMRKYVMFARCFRPKLTERAAQVLVEEYKRLRLREVAGGCSSWRITVRQLESLIRLSEALARLHCDDDVKEEYVKRSSQLLNKSIVRVEQPDIALADEEERTKLLDDDEQESAAVGGDENEQPVEESEDPAVPVSRLKLTFDEYRRISNLLVLRMRQEEERTEAGEGGGVHQSQLVDWYLNEVQEEIDSEEELLIRKTVVDKVIQRLIEHDNILIPLTSTLDESGQEEESANDPLLVVHPNYVMEDE